MRYGIISSCQSAATSEIVKRSWACVHRAATLYQVPDLYLYICVQRATILKAFYCLKFRLFCKFAETYIRSVCRFCTAPDGCKPQCTGVTGPVLSMAVQVSRSRPRLCYLTNGRWYLRRQRCAVRYSRFVSYRIIIELWNRIIKSQVIAICMVCRAICIWHIFNLGKEYRCKMKWVIMD